MHGCSPSIGRGIAHILREKPPDALFYRIISILSQGVAEGKIKEDGWHSPMRGEDIVSPEPHL